MWLVLALLGAVFTSLTTILAKIGIKNVNSDFATLYRTGIVIICSAVVTGITGGFGDFANLSLENWLFLGLSGVATGLSWLCYFRALKLGDVNKVAPIDKSSFVLTGILFIIFFFDDTTKGGDVLTICMTAASMALMLAGTILMIDKKKSEDVKSKKWLIYAILSAVFASLVSLFVKLGLKGISSNFGTFIRTIVVLVFAGAIVLAKKEYKGVSQIDKKSWAFLTLSGLATGGAWLSEYGALNMEGSNPVVVSAVGKLAILLTMLLSFLILKEKYSKKSLFGLAVMTAGIVLIIVFGL